jgi:hypothetical protein
MDDIRINKEKIGKFRGESGRRIQIKSIHMRKLRNE